MRKSILLFAAALFLISCKGVEDITFTGIDNVVLLGIEQNKVNFSADIGVYNPSTMSFKISEVNLKTSIDGTFIGTLSATEPVKIHAKTDTTYHTNFSLELASLISGASTLYGLSRKKQVTIDLQGFIRARSWLAFRKVDVTETQTIDVPAFVK